MKFPVFIVVISLLLLLTACGTVATPVEKAISDTADENVASNEGKEEIHVPSHEMPKEVPVLFTPVEYVELRHGLPDEEKELVQVIELGKILGEDVSLNVYKGTSELGTCSFDYETQSFLVVGDSYFDIGECTAWDLALQESMDAIKSIHYQTESQYMVASIPLATNTPGRNIMILFDSDLEKWLSFEFWGTPHFIQLDEMDYNELVVQFEGGGMNWPDVTIYRWNKGSWEASQSIKSILQISSVGQVTFIPSEKLFEILLPTDDLQNENMLKFRYEQEKLIMLE